MRFVYTAVMLVITASPIRAQWSIDAQGGRIRSSLDPAATAAESFVLGLRYEALATQFRISGGVPTKNEDPLWGAIAGAQRIALRKNGVIAGVDVVGNAFLTHDRMDRTQTVTDFFGRPSVVPGQSYSGHAIAVQGMPVLGYEAKNFQVQARAGASFYQSKFGEQERDRTVTLADAQLTLLPSPSFALMPSARFVRADEGDFKYAGVSGVVATGPVSFWANVGQWLDVDSAKAAYAAGGALKINSRVTLNTSVRRDSFDPVYLIPASTSWSVGASIRLGGGSAPVAPVPAAYVNGRATIRLPVSQSKTPPSVAGDFNKWKPQPMELKDGAWIYTVALAPGVYQYAFVNERGEWFVPEKHAGRKEDGMGGHVAVLVVQ
jgi:hypothetical protein